MCALSWPESKVKMYLRMLNGSNSVKAKKAYKAADHPPEVAAGHGLQEVREESTDSLKLHLPRTHIHTLKELITYAEVDENIWECERFIANKWEMGAKDDAGVVHVTPLFQVKATFKRKVYMQAVRAEIDALIDFAKQKMPTFQRVKYPKATSGNLIEISPMDHHFGMFSWAEECGANYDSKIASRIWWDMMEDIRHRTKIYDPEKYLFVLGNDLLHVDNPDNTTTKGTRQDVDSRYHKTFRSTARIMIDSIRFLKDLAPVDVSMIEGNHDMNAVFHVGEVLSAYFHACSDVKIDNSPKVRKYYQWGDVMLMFTHGHKGKRDKFPLMMPVEERALWGKTKFAEIHTGHLHHTRVEEFNGIRVRILPSLVAQNAWSNGEGYVGAVRATESFIWNKSNGLIGTAIFNVGNSEKYDSDSPQPATGDRPSGLQAKRKR
jgi:hypothetical protein